MADEPSYREIVKSSAIIGLSSVLGILANLIKLKFAAILLGPAGIGLIGIFGNVVSVFSAVSSLGFGTAGTRRITTANTEGEPHAVTQRRHALFWGTVGLSIVGGLVFLCTIDMIAVDFLKRPDLQLEIAWLAVAVSATVLLGYQSAVLTGLRHVKDLAKIRVISGFLSAAFSIVVLWIWGRYAIVLVVLSTPVLTLLVGRIYLSRIPTTGEKTPSLRDTIQEWRVTASLGFAFMVSTVVCLTGDLIVRTTIQNQLGVESLGHFQAAWAISMANLGLILGAMSVDFFPRLVSAISDPAKARRMINEQTEVALLVCAPLILFVLGFATWLVQLLYTAEFLPAVEIIHLLVLADVLKIISWPLGITLMAAGAGKTYFFTETSASAILVGVVILATPVIGLMAAGLASLVLYTLYLPLVYCILRRKLSFRWSKRVLSHATALFAAAVTIVALAQVSHSVSTLVSLVLSLGFGWHSISSLTRMTNVDGRLARLVSISKKIKRLLGK